MEFPPFEHAAWLAEAWKDGAPPHDLGASGFRSPLIDAILPRDRQPHDAEGLDLHSAIQLRTDVAAMEGLEPENVRITAGTSGANTAVLASLIRPGTNVVCERPTYTPLAALARGFGAEVRWIDHGSEGLDVDAVAAACDGKTAAILVTSPNNPTGRALTAAQFDVLGDAAEQHGAHVLADQVYQQLTSHALGSDHPAVVTTTGLNKCWGAPGLRVGWATGAADIMQRVEETHRLLALAPPSWSTRMASQLLRHKETCQAALEAHLASAHTIYRDWCKQMGINDTPLGLTAFPTIDVDARALLADGILVVPGELFGKPGHVRLGFGAALNRLPAALEALGSGIRAQGF